MQRPCSCDFLQGKETNPEGIRQILNALETGEETQVEITYYRKDGKHDVVSNYNMLTFTAVSLNV